MNRDDVYITISKCRYEELLRKELKCESLPTLNIRIELQTALNKFYYHCNDREFEGVFSKICYKYLTDMNNKLEEMKTLYNKIPWWKKII